MDNTDEEYYRLTPEGAMTVLRIDELFRTTDYTVERIAWEVGLHDDEEVTAVDCLRLMYAMGVLSGLIDYAAELRERLGDDWMDQ